MEKVKLKRVRNRLFSTNEFQSQFDRHKIKYKVVGNYLLVGGNKYTYKWQIHVSVVWSEIEGLLKNIFPILCQNGLQFQLVKNIPTAVKMNDGDLGNNTVGRVLTFFPKSDEEARQIAWTLIKTTEQINGPKILNSYYLGGTIYTESIDQKRSPWPFGDIRKQENITDVNFLENGRYRIVSILKDHPKGRVIYAIRWKFPFIQRCILKEARKHVISDEETGDMHSRLEWQYELHQRLEKKANLPRAYELFEEPGGDLFLSLEYIKGVSLHTFIKNTYRDQNWDQIAKSKKLTVINILLDILANIATLHEHGFIHRDLTPTNFMIARRSKVFLIDLELSHPIQGLARPPFKGGTDGYRSPEQIRSMQPTIKEDIYAFGALMIRVFTNKEAFTLGLQKVKDSEKKIRHTIQDERISDLIIKCLKHNPSLRPNVTDVKLELLAIAATIENGSRMIKDN